MYDFQMPGSLDQIKSCLIMLTVSEKDVLMSCNVLDCLQGGNFEGG